jgi:transcriptional regulator with XRE-family HTH domain
VTEPCPSRPPIAQRLKAARQRAGLTEEEVAQRAGLSLPSYWDLEAHDDEAFMCLSIRELLSLARVLAVSPRDVLADEGVHSRAGLIPIAAVAERIQAFLTTNGETAGEFGNRVGWDVGSVLESPARAFDEWNLDCLQDVCRAVGLDWLTVVPPQ